MPQHNHKQHRSRNNNILHDRVLALAAMMQCAHLVSGIARKGVADAVEIETCISSIFASSGDTPEQMYGDIAKLRTGLVTLSRLLQGEDMSKDVQRTKELMAYTAAMMTLERKLARNPAMLKKLAEGMQRIEKQSEYFNGIMHDNVIAAISDLYGETISTMKPRIIVRGKSDYLRHSGNTDKVRALLLAGIRGAHLWRMHGGSHLQLLLRRRALGGKATELLRHV
ncbi:MAG: high frequency lysogenization protein HflD [Mariprofundaceae bacterium]|nr:high frequency lysogenization protein HflD [Mariprofundaceae bacterium]